MDQDNFIETFYRLTNTDESLQRLLTFRKGRNTTIKYIGNYLDDTQEINLSLNTPLLGDSSKSKTLIIDQVTLISTNPNLTDFIPLRLSIGGKVLPFIVDNSTTISKYNVITEKFGILDKLDNNQWSKFSYYLPQRDSLSGFFKQVVATKTGSEIDLVNDRIFITQNNKVYVSTIQNMIDKVQFTDFSAGQFTGVLDGRLKTNGYNVVIANNTTPSILYDLRWTPTAKEINATGTDRFICYDPFSIDGKLGTIAISADLSLIEPYDDSPQVILIDCLFENEILFTADASVSTNDKERLSRSQSITMINLNFAIVVSIGAEPDEAGSIGLLFLDTVFNRYIVRFVDPPSDFEYAPVPLFPSFQSDIVVSLNEDSTLPQTPQDPFDFIVGFTYNDGGEQLFIEAKVDNIFEYTIINQQQINAINPTSLWNTRRYRNLLLIQGDRQDSQQYKLTEQGYLSYNSTTREIQNIPTINKLYDFESLDFFINNHYFIELGRHRYDGKPNDDFIINISLNDRNGINKVTSYTRDYGGATYNIEDSSNITLSVLNAPQDFALELLKVVIDIRLKNSKEKVSRPKATKKKKEDKRKRKINTDVKEILGLNAGPEVIRDIFNLI